MQARCTNGARQQLPCLVSARLELALPLAEGGHTARHFPDPPLKRLPTEGVALTISPVAGKYMELIWMRPWRHTRRTRANKHLVANCRL